MTNHAPRQALPGRGRITGHLLLKCVRVGERSVGRCYSVWLISSYWASKSCFLASIGASGVEFGLLQEGAARAKYTRAAAPSTRRPSAFRRAPTPKEKTKANTKQLAAAPHYAVADRHITGRRARTRSATTPAARARSRRRRAPSRRARRRPGPITARRRPLLRDAPRTRAAPARP